MKPDLEKILRDAGNGVISKTIAINAMKEAWNIAVETCAEIEPTIYWTRHIDEEPKPCISKSNILKNKIQ